jgi:hypothetical protein
VTPAAGIGDSVSRVLALGAAPVLETLAISVAGAVVVSFLGFPVLKKLEPNFADMI